LSSPAESIGPTGQERRDDEPIHLLFPIYNNQVLPIRHFLNCHELSVFAGHYA
jgi:hypothetical protein